MVFTTAVNFIRARGPDEFWRKRKIFKLAAVRIQYLLVLYSENVLTIYNFLGICWEEKKLLQHHNSQCSQSFSLCNKSKEIKTERHGKCILSLIIVCH